MSVICSPALKKYQISPMYVIVGIEPSASRTIPVEYIAVTKIAFTELELYDIIVGMKQFRVLEIGNQYKTMEEILADKAERIQDIEKEKRRKLYEELRNEFEQQ